MSQLANTYLQKCYERIVTEFFSQFTSEIDFTKIQITYGFPSKGGSKRNNTTIGEAWLGEHRVILINPSLFTEANDNQILGVIIHEIIHHIYPRAGHKGAFKSLAIASGLEGKMTATVCSNELRERLNGLDLPSQPICDLQPSTQKKDTTRLVKAVCGCMRILRLSRKVYDEGEITCNICDEVFKAE